MTRPRSIRAVRLRPSVRRFALFKDERLLRFDYVVNYGSDSPEDGDAPLTDNELMKVLGRFRDGQRGDVLATDPKDTADALLTKTNRALARTLVVKTTSGTGTVDEALHRCALRHQLKATSLRCTRQVKEGGQR